MRASFSSVTTDGKSETPASPIAIPSITISTVNTVRPGASLAPASLTVTYRMNRMPTHTSPRRTCVSHLFSSARTLRVASAVTCVNVPPNSVRGASTAASLMPSRPSPVCRRRSVSKAALPTHAGCYAGVSSAVGAGVRRAVR